MFSEHVQDTSRPNSRAEAREHTAQRVIAAADRLFRTRGFRETTIRDLAAAADVSVGTVMGIGDKDALLIAVFDRRIAEIHRHRTVQGQPPGRADVGATLADRLTALVVPFVETFTGHPDLARQYAGVLIAGTHRSETFGRLALALLQEFREALRAETPLADSGIDAKADALYHGYLGCLFAAAARNEVDAATVIQHIRQTFAAICEDHRQEPR